MGRASPSPGTPFPVLTGPAVSGRLPRTVCTSFTSNPAIARASLGLAAISRGGTSRPDIHEPMASAEVVIPRKKNLKTLTSGQETQRQGVTSVELDPLLLVDCGRGVQ